VGSSAMARAAVVGFTHLIWLAIYLVGACFQLVGFFDQPFGFQF
jgi:hypothetical protein